MILAIMRVYNYLLIIEFLVIVLMISKEIIVEVLGLPERGALSTCLGLTIVPSI